MKIKELLKIVSKRNYIRLLTDEGYGYRCRLDKDPYDCPDNDFEYSCEGCDYLYRCKETSFKWEGLAEDFPIKYADLIIKSIIAEPTFKKNGCSKCKETAYNYKHTNIVILVNGDKFDDVV